jgi:hypothetical protein
MKLIAVGDVEIKCYLRILKGKTKPNVRERDNVHMELSS